VKSFLCAVVVMVVSGCSPVQRYDSSFLAMGTQMDVTLMTDSDERAARATEEIEHAMTRWSKDWYPWDNNDDESGTDNIDNTKNNNDGPGELKQLNAALSSGGSFTVSSELSDLIQKAQKLSEASSGYFDPAVAPMVQRWGLNTPNHPPTKLPTEQAIEEWFHDHATIRDVIIRGNELSSTRSDLQLDMGAIAKGFALDQLGQHLQQRGIVAATLNIGGQVLVLGNMDIRSRTVNIRDPSSSSPLATVILNNGESISTSGDYERYFVIEGHRIHHLLDPHTGRSVNATRWVSVIATTGTLADAASTAIMAAGDDWRRIAKQMGVSQVLRVCASGEIQVTGAMYARLNQRHFPRIFSPVTN